MVILGVTDTSTPSTLFNKQQMHLLNSIYIHKNYPFGVVEVNIPDFWTIKIFFHSNIYF